MDNLKIKNFIFDFDGTLINSKDLMIKIALEIAPEIKVKVSFTDKANLEMFRGMTSKQLIKHFNIKFIYIPKIIKLFFTKYDPQICGIPFINGIKNILETLHKNNNFLGVLSTNSTENIKKMLEKEEISFVNDIYCSKGLYFMKNIMLLRFIKKNKLNKNETIYIGDEVRDIQAAKKAGIKVGSVLWGMNTKEILLQYNPDYIFEKPEDILKLI